MSKLIMQSPLVPHHGGLNSGFASLETWLNGERASANKRVHGVRGIHGVHELGGLTLARTGIL